MGTRGPSSHRCGWTKILCSIGSLLFLLVATNAAWPQKAPDKGVLLAERHKAAGIECAQCHKDKPSAPAPTKVCAGCHGDIDKTPKTKANRPNPHDSHMPFPDCADCHHTHKPSQNQCDNCHNFGYKIR